MSAPQDESPPDLATGTLISGFQTPEPWEQMSEFVVPVCGPVPVAAGGSCLYGTSAVSSHSKQQDSGRARHPAPAMHWL